MRITKSPYNIYISEDAPILRGIKGDDILKIIPKGFNVTSIVAVRD